MLVEFASVVDAVRCAVEMQRGDGRAQCRRADDRRIEFRIGINLGDIIVEEQRHLRRRRQYRGAAGGAGRAGRHLHLAHGARPDPRQAALCVRGSRRAAGQEHRPAGAGLRDDAEAIAATELAAAPAAPAAAARRRIGDRSRLAVDPARDRRRRAGGLGAHLATPQRQAAVVQPRAGIAGAAGAAAVDRRAAVREPVARSRPGLFRRRRSPRI